MMNTILTSASITGMPESYSDHALSHRFAIEHGLGKAVSVPVEDWSEQIIRRLIPDENLHNTFFDGLRKAFIKEPEWFENDSYNLNIGATRM